MVKFHRDCPIKCGDCCKYGWYDVPELADQFEDEAWDIGEENKRVPCPLWSDAGCLLPVPVRPPACVNYLCTVARGELGIETHDAAEQCVRDAREALGDLHLDSRRYAFLEVVVEALKGK